MMIGKEVVRVCLVPSRALLGLDVEFVCLFFKPLLSWMNSDVHRGKQLISVFINSVLF